MTIRFLLDASIVSAPLAKTPDPAVMRRLERHGHECAIGAPVWHELVFGVRRLPRGKRQDALSSYLDDVVAPTFPVLPYDETAAAWHGRERARLERKGTPAPYVDGQIAAIAQTNGLVLVTANAKDFTRYAELDVENWTTRR